MATISADHSCRFNDSTVSQSCPVANESPLLVDADIDKIVERKLRTTNFRVSHWSLDPLSVVLGFLGTYYSLNVTVKVGEKSKRFKFFAKTMPLKDGIQYQFLQTNSAFDKEIVFYDQLIPRMGVGKGSKWMPDFYLGKQSRIIVLEDAMEDGYSTMNKYKLFEVDHLVHTTIALSMLHSRALILDEKLRRGTGQTVYDVYGGVLHEVGLNMKIENTYRFLLSSTKGAEALIDLVEGMTSEEGAALKKWIAQAISQLWRAFATSTKYRNVITHGDVWSNNLMFKYDANGKVANCYLVDFQFIRYVPPAIDLMMFIYVATDRATRDRCYDRLIDVYCDVMRKELASEGLNSEECLSRAEFVQSCEEMRDSALAQAIAYLPVQILPNEAVHKYFVKADSLTDVMHGDRRGELMRDLCRESESYKLRLLELIVELRDLLAKRDRDAAAQC